MNEHSKRDAHWVGMDVSKEKFDAGLARKWQRFPSTSLAELPWKTFSRTEAGVVEFLTWLDAQVAQGADTQVRVVTHATGSYSVELAAWLIKHRPSLAPAIVNPARTKAYIDSLGQRNKTDGLEARGLAFYGVDRAPVAYEFPTPDRQELRTLTRFREVLIRERTALKNRHHEPCGSRTVRTMLERRLRQLNKDIVKLEVAIQRVIHEAPGLRNDFVLLKSIAGVGPITAAIVLAELGDLRRFDRARQLTAFAGLSPMLHESGTSVHKKTRMCKVGNTRVRQALFMSAMALLRTKTPHPLKQMHRHLCDQGKIPKAALGAVMRKQLVLMRAVLISGKPYDPLWRTCPATLAPQAN